MTVGKKVYNSVRKGEVMLSKGQIKYVQSLKIKKYRQQYGCFVAEGPKTVEELIHTGSAPLHLYGTNDFFDQHADIVQTFQAQCETVSAKELERLSHLKTPNQVLGVWQMPEYTLKDLDLPSGLTLLLDDIRDPGNLGTIIRTADWFNIPCLICSPTCVDVYNPKVVQSTMGSIARVKVLYQELADVISQHPNLPVIGALLEGASTHTIAFPENAFLLIGNEAKGIAPQLIKRITQPITIPKYGQAESLNAAMAMGIICAAYRMQYA